MRVVDAIHSYGGLVFHDVINRRHANKAAAAGVDGLIAVCAGAGGHAGLLSPFRIRSRDSPILRQDPDSLWRDHAWPSDCRRGVDVDADLAYLGTRFINTREAPSAVRSQTDDPRCHRQLTSCTHPLSAACTRIFSRRASSPPAPIRITCIRRQNSTFRPRANRKPGGTCGRRGRESEASSRIFPFGGLRLCGRLIAEYREALAGLREPHRISRAS